MYKGGDIYIHIGKRLQIINAHSLLYGIQRILFLSKKKKYIDSYAAMESEWYGNSFLSRTTQCGKIIT